MLNRQKLIYRYLLTIDPSLTCSGWALFNIADEKLIGVGKIRAPGPKVSLNLRYSDVQRQVNQFYSSIEFGQQDILVCEAPTTMRDPNAAIKVEQIRGIFETLGRNLGATVPGRINPRTVHHEILGLKGKQAKRNIVKETARTVAHHLYSQALAQIGFAESCRLAKHQDIVDALLIANIVLSRIKRLSQSNVSLADCPISLW